MLAAFALGRGARPEPVDQLVGQSINVFDPESPTRLRIVKFDSASGSVNEFEVAKQDGDWTIPSKQGYPADATVHMGDAASCIASRKVLRVQSTSPQDHAELGLVDPLSSGLDSKSTGVGTRVVMADAKDENLVDMIIGAKVKDSEDQYYVRRSNQDVSFVVSLDPSKLTTSFEDWIEDDLLSLNTFDMRKLFLNDYSAQLGMALGPQGIQMQVSWDRRGQFTFNYDAADSKWKPELLQQFDPSSEQMVPFQLQEDEELNEDALRELRNGLDDLLIVDVEKKPAGLSADLKAGNDFLASENRQTLQSLLDRGFAPVPLSSDSLEILSSEGEVICGLRNGVEYVLRFGKIKAAAVAETEKTQEAAEGAEKADDLPESQLNRYLFVMARFNENLVEKPKLKQLPELPPEATPSDAAPKAPAANDRAASGGDNGAPASIDAVAPPANADVSAPSAPPAAQPPAAESEEEEEETSAATPPSAESAGQPPADGQSASPESSAPQLIDAPRANEPPPADVQKAAPPSADSAPSAQDAASKNSAADTPETSTPAASESATQTDEATPADAAKPAEPESLESLIARRKSIESENNRQLEEYQKSITEGKEKVEELNERFGDWYYVISDKVYKQIHVGRDQLVQKKKADDKQNAAGGDENAVPGIPGLPNLPIGK